VELTHLKNKDINTVKWDNCINKSYNGNIYAFSWYLDIICEDWEGIIEDDYKTIMPVLPSRKFGFPFTFVSPLARQLGVYSTNILDKSKVSEFVKTLSKTYKMFNINLNKYNQIDPELFFQTSKNTYEFDIIGNYKVISSYFTKETLKKIEEALKNKISVSKGLVPNELINFSQRRDVITTNLTLNELSQLRRIISFILRHGLGEILAAYDQYNELMATLFFLKSNRKINILHSAVTKEGVKSSAMYLLVDEYLRKNNQKQLTLNFENLEIPIKEEFFKGFGAKANSYLNVRNKKLPIHKKLILKKFSE
jgi:hypothetical protein